MGINCFETPYVEEKHTNNPLVSFVIFGLGSPADVAACRQSESTNCASMNWRRSGMSISVSSTLSASLYSSGK